MVSERGSKTPETIFAELDADYEAKMNEGLDMSVILAKRILVLIRQSGATAKEQKAALDLVRDKVLEALYAS